MSRISEVFNWTENENRRVILEFLERNDKARLIDLGCWNGVFTQKIAEKIGTQYTWGVEVDYEQRLNAESRGIKVIQADLNETLPIEDESFDVVHSNQVIEHVYETDLLLKEMYRILKEGGYAIISTPNLAGWHNILSLLMGLQPFPAHVSNEVYVGNKYSPLHNHTVGNKGLVHLRIFTYASLKELCEYHGFKVEKAVGVGFYPFIRTIPRLYSKIGRKHAVYLTLKLRR